jgi:Putative prokaryotic signal transducing protein
VEEPVVLDVVPTETEAELVVSLLRGAGIECAHRVSNRAAGAFAQAGGVGPYEILVHSEDVEAAREVLSAEPE